MDVPLGTNARNKSLWHSFSARSHEVYGADTEFEKRQRLPRGDPSLMGR